MIEPLVCKWCGEIAEFIHGKGWVHKGGGIYVQVCKRCGKKFSFRKVTFYCPDCGGNLIDDHCILPVKGGRK